MCIYELVPVTKKNGQTRIGHALSCSISQSRLPNKISKIEWLKEEKFIFRILKSGSLRPGCQPAWSGSGESPLPSLLMTAFHCAPHGSDVWEGERENDHIGG